jgi:hypothetical protein
MIDEKKLIEGLNELIADSYYKSVEGNKVAGIENNAYHNVRKMVFKLAEEYKTDITFQYVVLQTDILKRMGIDISSKWETATQQAYALNEAYMRGRQDESDKFARLQDEHKGGWIPCSERLPEDDTKQYIVQKTNGFIDILGFTKDAYKLSRYDFYEYKGKKKQLFYDCDSEYGYSEWKCEAWMPLPELYKGE